MTKVLIATVKPFAPAAVEQIRQIFQKSGFEVSLLEKYNDKSDFLAAVADADALIVRSDIVDDEVLENAKNLKIVVRAGAGYDNIDLDAASKRDIIVMNTPGQNSNAVAELALGMMVFMARNKLNGTAGTELKRKKIGIHAYGYVGRIVAMIAKGFGMEVLAYDPFVDRVIIENDGVTYVSDVKQLYQNCQYISLHIPANKETKESIHYDLLSLMPKGAMLVNTARKEVIHEESLIKMFDTRNDFRYATDIAPDCADEIVKNHADRYFATPKKMGAQTSEANINAGVAAANQIVNFVTKGDNTFQVN